MKTITKLMYDEFNIKKLGVDFMGYEVKRKESLSFHHLIIAHKDCKRLAIPSEGYVRWNGALLVQETSHDYLHIIERVDLEIFYRITSEMVDENLKGKIDIENLRRINDLLLFFEKEHISDRTKNGKTLIKREYLKRVTRTK